MRKLNKKGFTLVEIVIVIVIIAILAAMLVPALTQWINKSKMKTFTSACDTIRTSVSSCIAEEYAVNSTVSKLSDINGWEARVGNDINAKIVGGANLSGGAKYAIVDTATPNSMTITDGKFTGTWDGTKWTVE